MCQPWVCACLVVLAAGRGIEGAALQTRDGTNIRQALETVRASHRLPAMAGAVLTSHEVVMADVTGVRRAGSTVAALRNDAFHLGSDTKAMTATLLGILVEEKRIRWDTTLADALPELAAKMNPAYRGVPLELMLAHRAGMSDASWPGGKSTADMFQQPGDIRQQRAAYTAAVLAEPPVYRPGSRYLYSNRDYVVAGAIIERLTGHSWEQVIQSRLFEPLGMTTAGFGSMGTPGTVDAPWQHVPRPPGVVPVPPGPRSDNPPVLGPAGTVHCSVEDWAKFIQMHLQGEQGRKTLLKPETIRYMHTAPGDGGYGFGWLITDRPWGGGTVFTHAGSNTMNYCVVWMAPLKDFAVLVMTNEGGGEAARACDEAAGALIKQYLSAGIHAR